MQYNSKFDDILIEFSKMFPSTYSKVVDWYPTGRTEIKMTLSDGSKIIYDRRDRTMRTIKTFESMSPISLTEVQQHFGSVVVSKMYEKGWNRQDLADASGISYQMLNKYINGQVVPNMHVLLKLARTLECSLSELTEYDI